MAKITYKVDPTGRIKERDILDTHLQRIIGAATFNLKNLKKLEGPRFPDIDDDVLTLCIEIYSELL